VGSYGIVQGSVIVRVPPPITLRVRLPGAAAALARRR